MSEVVDSFLPRQFYCYTSSVMAEAINSMLLGKEYQIPPGVASSAQQMMEAASGNTTDLHSIQTYGALMEALENSHADDLDRITRLTAELFTDGVHAVRRNPAEFCKLEKFFIAYRELGAREAYGNFMEASCPTH